MRNFIKNIGKGAALAIGAFLGVLLILFTTAVISDIHNRHEIESKYIFTSVDKFDEDLLEADEYDNFYQMWVIPVSAGIYPNENDKDVVYYVSSHRGGATEEQYSDCWKFYHDHYGI